MYNKAYELGYPRRLENPTQNIKPFKEKSRVRYLSQEELQRFFEALKYSNTVFRNYVLLSLLLAQRRSNMLSLRWSDVDLENGFVRFANTKNGDDVNIPVTTHAMDLLIQMRNDASDSPWLFPSDSSKSGHLEEPKSSWVSLLKRANIENMRIHDLRHTMGSYQAIEGSSLQIIGRSLGHKSIAATQIYAHLSAAPIRQSMQRATNGMLNNISQKYIEAVSL
jgi:integrase